MLKRTLLILAGAAVLGQSAFAQLFYGGDPDGRNGGNNSAFGGFDSIIFDDFNVTSPGWNVNDLHVNVVTSIARGDILTANFEIRQGVSVGNGGVLIASGSGAATVVANGFDLFGRTGYNVSLTGLNINLGVGTYFLGMSVGGNGTSNDMYVLTTSGANGVGGPLGNGNSFWDSSSFGFNYNDTQDVFGAGTWDLSQAVTGTVVPEPASMTALGLGLAAIAARRRRK